MSLSLWLRALPCLLIAVLLSNPQIAVAQTGGTMVPVSSAATGSQANMARLPKTDIFKTVAEASAHCPASTVVWSTLSKSRSFHLSGSRYYGTTKHGAYVCKSDALAFGFHQARS